MRFGRTLKTQVYSPWRDQYIDYDKLKQLLREAGSDQGIDPQDDDDWTEQDESAFVEELVNNQLEKVANFQKQTSQKLRDRTAECEKKLEPLGDGLQIKVEDADKKQEPNGEPSKADISENERNEILKSVLKELDEITKETNELERYSRINYTGFLKAAKKHDRRRGHNYRVRPLLQVRLSALPFNQEDYSPLLFRLSVMYSFVRQKLDGKSTQDTSFSDNQTSGESFVSHKFWVHPENLLEVKTVILRRLPVLVYNPQTSKIAEGSQRDPELTSIYFDNPKFSLYTKKVDHEPNATSLRLRWYGQLSEKPEILLEMKTIKEGDVSEEQRFPIKEKYIQPFIKGEYKMEKSIEKLKHRAGDANGDKVAEFEKSVDEIQSFILDNDLQPVVRANYSRTAFQIPGDDRVRISLDTNLAMIREDAIDAERPCRDPDDWHRKDIDDAEMEFPFSRIRKGEINRFPFALLEIKIKGNKQYEWIDDLMNSHLVTPAPRFSKFVQGVANLFEDYVNSFPFWLSQVETDIRRDPQQAFEEEQARRKKIADDDIAVGSLLSATRNSPALRQNLGSPVGSPARQREIAGSMSGRAMADMAKNAAVAGQEKTGKEDVVEEEDSDDDGVQGDSQEHESHGFAALFPSFSTSKYARARRERGGEAKLPPGVNTPTYWLKDQGPVKVEAKVWLANQRTFIKWQHVAILLASLSLGLYNAAGETNNIARSLAIVYTLVAVFAGIWGWGMYLYRSNLIEKRSGREMESMVGPIVVCIGLVIALSLNFGFKYHAAMLDRERESGQNGTSLFLHGELL
ncbi:SPX-domain-containing protein [Rhizodiscina lignyota]|uniref:SPX-domain-containing protein n=1 Tax=Rhizodiscina lignyota TaxID=1504668 RepID=A0A9P4I976_9PEZI|nr:SPX-domain-containing protein [Rhizodiscina lignyota]